MSVILHLEPKLFLCRFLLLSACWFGLASSQRNIETFYPPTPADADDAAAAVDSPPPSISDSPQYPPPLRYSPPSRKTVVKAVAATAACSLVVATLFFFVIQRRRRRNAPDHGSAEAGRLAPLPRGDFARFEGNMIKGLIVDENGLDVLYWRRLQTKGERTGSCLEKSLSKGVVRSPRGHEVGDVGGGRRDGDVRFDKLSQELPLLREEKLSSSWEDNNIVRVREERVREDAVSVNGALYPLPPPPSARVALLKAVERPRPIHQPPPPPAPPPRKPQEPLIFPAVSTAEQPPPPVPAAPPRPPSAVPPLTVPPPTPPPTPPRSPKKPLSFSALSTAGPPSRSLPAAPPRPPSAVPPPPAPPPAAPPLPPQPPAAAPPPPPLPARRSPVAPPPPPPSKLRGLDSSKKPPALTKGLEKQGKQGEPSASPGQMKLKPLHWEKFDANADHSMVWDKVGDGSFR